MEDAQDLIDRLAALRLDPRGIQTREDRRQFILKLVSQQLLGPADLPGPRLAHFLDGDVFALLDRQAQLPLLDLGQELACPQGGFLVRGWGITLQIVPAHELAPGRDLVKAVGGGLGGIGAFSPVLDRASRHPQDARQLDVVLRHSGLGRPGRDCHALEHGAFGAAQVAAPLDALGEVGDVAGEQLASDVGRDGVHAPRGLSKPPEVGGLPYERNLACAFQASAPSTESQAAESSKAVCIEEITPWSLPSTR
jgi:hypothetical protein